MTLSHTLAVEVDGHCNRSLLISLAGRGSGRAPKELGGRGGQCAGDDARQTEVDLTRRAGDDAADRDRRAAGLGRPSPRCRLARTAPFQLLDCSEGFLADASGFIGFGGLDHFLERAGNLPRLVLELGPAIIEQRLVT